MGAALAKIHGKTASDLKLNAFLVMALQYLIGAMSIKFAAGFIPFAGTAVNAVVSLATVQAVGWALHLVLSEGLDPGELTRRQVKEFIGRGRNLRKSMKDTPEYLHHLPPEKKREYDQLMSELRSPKTSFKRRQEIIGSLERLTRPYWPEDSDAV
jgi:uncharacterized protein (DUF697 family)